jgi:S-DNA-T family DNA segregation ATPase FtsK/SpoIIIE
LLPAKIWPPQRSDNRLFAMTEPLLISRQREMVRDLRALITERARVEPNIDAAFEQRNQAAEKEFQESCQAIITRFESEKDSSQSEFQTTEHRVRRRFEAERAAQDKEFHETRQWLTSQFETESAAAKDEYQKARTAYGAAYKENRRKADLHLAESLEKLADARDKAKEMERDARAWLRACLQDHDYGPLPPASRPDRTYKDAFRQLQECLTNAEEHLDELQELRLPRLFRGKAFIAYYLLLVLVGAGAPLPFMSSANDRQAVLFGVGIGAGCALLLAGAVGLWLYYAAKRQIAQVYLPLRQSFVEIEEQCGKAEDQARGEYGRRLTQAKKVRETEADRAAGRYRKRRTALKERHNTEWREAEQKYQSKVAESTHHRDTDLREAHEKYQKLRAQIYERYENDSHHSHEHRYQQMSDSKAIHEQQWNTLVSGWQQGLAQVHSVAEEVRRESQQLFPEWSSPVWNEWAPSGAVPPVIYFGKYYVDLDQFPEGLSENERLKPAVPTQYTLPALLDFPARCSLLIKATDEGRMHAVGLLQSVMLRYLTSLPPGKVRFTIIDPMGLGENFGGFMHLADYDEMLVNSRIWTEMAHIEQRLSDMTAHMENVLQKYLRNQYETIEAYNAEAGEVAEPFRILVVANFPANFSAEAARRLVSIVGSGARCGVYTLLSVDTKQELPQGFALDNIEERSVSLEWQGQRFVWGDVDFADFPLRVEKPPAPEFCTRVLNIVGEKAREANRVEVPFDFIAPAPDQYWKSDSRSGVDVALGRAGATKRQHLKLGQGTSQHVLIAGKTGSGKSTLLHALVVNVSLLYSPDEIELYLIDFKKGVEFKTYATHELPHARVVAIESDREFGLSVLQRLDAELKLRGERFRQAGAQDLNSYRETDGAARLPRILLVVDEFQEFFVEDDKVAQEASQLLDRLVRQGRAFGLHILLGSQTLGGAYSLARSTVDQMAVRIALQCSEADAHLILSDDNSAARLLSRPGEAIYNDANGLVEGNNPFQVVWLPEPRRDSILDLVRDMDHKRNGGTSRTPIVFEGNALADIAKNDLLKELVVARTWPPAPRAVHAWLGEPMAIKEPTSAVFRRQSASNLLLVGQQDEAALGALVTALLSLAAQHEPTNDLNRSAGARFLVLDGCPSDSAYAGYLARITELIPHTVQVGGWRELPQVIGELAELVDRRQKTNETDGPATYLFIYGLQRFRDLRRDEDDFGFSRGEDKPSPAKQFAAIVRDGAAVGVHVVVWGDTLTNITRALDRQAMREFDMRVLFQMSSADSSALIDSPVAGKLGMQRALFHSEEEGRLEKFRPYGLPNETWLAWLKHEMSGKHIAQPVRQKA